MKQQVSESRHERDSWCVNVFRDSVWMKKQVSETGHERASWWVNAFRDAHLVEIEALPVTVRDARLDDEAGL